MDEYIEWDCDFSGHNDCGDLLFDSIMNGPAEPANTSRAKPEKTLSRSEKMAEFEKTGIEYTGIDPDTVLFCGDGESYEEIYMMEANKIAGGEASADPYDVLYCGGEYSQWKEPEEPLFTLNQYMKPERITAIQFTEMRPTMSIPLENGAEIKCGIHQKLLVKTRDDVIGWVMAKDIRKGDVILSPELYGCFGEGKKTEE